MSSPINSPAQSGPYNNCFGQLACNRLNGGKFQIAQNIYCQSSSSNQNFVTCTEKNQEIAKQNETKENPDVAATSDEVLFTDIVDAGKEAITLNDEKVTTDDKEQSKTFQILILLNFLLDFRLRGRSQTTFTREGGQVVKKIDFL